MRIQKEIILTVFGVGFFLITVLPSVTRAEAAVLFIDEYGHRHYVASGGQVLGEGSGDGEKKEEKKEDKREDSSGSDSSGSGSSGSGSSGSSVSRPDSPSQPGRNVVPKKQRIELRSPSERVKFESETRKDGSVRVKQEIRTQEGKTRIEARDGRLEIRFKPTEDEDELDDDRDNDEDEEEATGAGQPIGVVRVRERFDKNELEIRAEGSRIEIKQGKTRVRTNFPLTIGPNNELIVTTPAGSRQVTVLPDTAVANLLRSGVLTATTDLLGKTGTATGATGIDGVTGIARETGAEGATGAVGVEEAIPTGGVVAQPEPSVILGEDEGKLVYKVRGTKDVRFLGFVPVVVPVEANVSAETGAVSSVVQPFYLNLFGFLFR